MHGSAVKGAFMYKTKLQIFQGLSFWWVNHFTLRIAGFRKYNSVGSTDGAYIFPSCLIIVNSSVDGQCSVIHMEG